MVGLTKGMTIKATKILCELLAILAFTACSNNDDNAGSERHLYTVTLNASMGDATTRALDKGEGNAINATFEKDDKVVVTNASGTEIGTLTAQTAGASTTLTGTLDASALTSNQKVTLHYLQSSVRYDNQDGTLTGIASNNDYAKGTLTVSSTDPLTFTSNSVTLAAQQSITKFSFTHGTKSVSVKTFGIAADGLVRKIATNGYETLGPASGTLSSASSDVYVAIRNNSTTKQTYTFYIKDDAGKWYTGTKSANLANGKNYTATVVLTQLSALTTSSNEGTIGVTDGLPAIVVNISGTKKAIALMNAGALCPEAYGKYYSFDKNLSTAVTDGWYVPTQAELTALAGKTKTWGTLHGVNGCRFTIGSNTLFLPAAGYYDNADDDGNSNAKGFYYLVSSFGYYWSQTSINDDTANSFQFSDNSSGTYTGYKVNGLSVRSFHALP